MEVQLYVYDLTQGLARQMSRQLLGVQIDAVYHTSLVFEGIEYFFGRGVQTCYPGMTHHGRPMEIKSLGQTALPLDVILEYLESLKEVYTAESYDLFAHNCNNFTNDFAMFLVGRGIPDHITSLPKTVLDTPFGQMLRPQLENVMRPVTQAPTPRPLATINGSSSRTAPARNGVISSQSTKMHSQVYHVTTESRLNQLLDQSKTSCAVIFFTSASCAPCKMLYPVFDELAAEFGNKANLIKVDISNAREIGLKYSIRATPTFTTFLKGKQEETWSGADASRLRGSVRLLVQTAFPPHPHQLLKLSKFSRQSTKQISYAKVPPLEKLQAKMGQASSQLAVKQSLDFIRSRNSEATAPQSTAIPDLPLISSFLISSLASVPTENLFAIYDLFRLLLVDPRVSGYYAQEDSHKTILALFTHVTSLQASSDPCPYNLRLCTLHAACNLFTTPLFRTALRSASTSDDLVSVLSALVASALLDDSHSALRVSASALAFNLATLEHLERRKMMEDHGTVDSNTKFLLSESHQVELAASLLEALSASMAVTDAETEATKLRALALGRLVYFAPRDGEVMDLCRALDARSTFLAKAEQIGGGKGKAAVNGAAKDTGVDELKALMHEIGIELLKEL